MEIVAMTLRLSLNEWKGMRNEPYILNIGGAITTIIVNAPPLRQATVNSSRNAMRDDFAQAISDAQGREDSRAMRRAIKGKRRKRRPTRAKAPQAKKENGLTRRKFSDEFRAQALDLVKTKSVKEAAKELRITESLLYAWKRNNKKKKAVA